MLRIFIEDVSIIDVVVCASLKNILPHFSSGKSKNDAILPSRMQFKATKQLLGNHIGEGHLRNGNLLRKGSVSEISNSGQKKEKWKEDGKRQHLSESNLKRLVTATVEFDNCQTTLPRY
ncbi:hypothetical protein CDAR_179171 [Caerostris darwini]|uniref:Uncharacterized protein n=1 Tax=Caerostris darwini TaxID=1538125 RepID=A0AAV4P9Y3_9ARAC|nr:hypothetical protein CDAR_179171 [Caerostris darwini]